MGGDIKRIGFIAVRLAGTDGVSLEVCKWVDILERNGYECFYFGGELDTPERSSLIEPLARFDHPEISALHDECFSQNQRPGRISNRFQELKDHLKSKLYEFKKLFKIDLVIPQNILAIPMHIPLGLAVTEFLAETGIPCIAHHHDFSWERDRFIINCVKDYLDYAFPPALPNIRHVVINSAAGRNLAFRKGVSYEVVPNVLDFNKPKDNEAPKELLRRDFGFAENEIMVLQPTRIVPRKQIERAIDIVSMMETEKPRLVISHMSGDEGDEYMERIREYAGRNNVELVLFGDLVESKNCFGGQRSKPYNIDDLYQAADLVTYPSVYEGFGNAFLEAVYFNKIIAVNRYPVFIEDIEPLGFELAVFDSVVTTHTIERIKQLTAGDEAGRAVETNYSIAAKHFSYEVLEKKLIPLVRFFEA